MGFLTVVCSGVDVKAAFVLESFLTHWTCVRLRLLARLVNDVAALALGFRLNVCNMLTYRYKSPLFQQSNGTLAEIK